MLLALHTGLYAWEIVRTPHLSGFFFMLLYTTVCQSLTENNSLSIKHLSSAHTPLSVNSRICASGFNSMHIKRLCSPQEPHQTGGMSSETHCCHSFNVVSKYGLYTGTEAANGAASFSSSLKMDARLTPARSSAADDFAGLQSAIGNHNAPSVSGGRHQNIFTSQHTKQRPNSGSSILNTEKTMTHGEEDETASSTKHQKPNIAGKHRTIKTHSESRHYSAFQSSTSAVVEKGKHFSSLVYAKKKHTLNTFVRLTRTSTHDIPVLIVTPHENFSGSASSLDVTGALLKTNALSSRDGRSKSTFLPHYSAGLTTQAQKLSSSSSTVQYLPHVSPSYTAGYAVELFAKSTKTRLAISTKANTRPLAGLSHKALSSSVSFAVTESTKTTSVCVVNNKSCACFNCNEARRTKEKMACCVDLIDRKVIRHAAKIRLVNITVREVSVSTTSRIIAEVVQEWCTIGVCINTGFAVQRRRRSSPYQSQVLNATSSSGYPKPSSDDENNYQHYSDTVKTQSLSHKPLKPSTSIKQEALHPEVSPTNMNISSINAIIYHISSEPAKPQTVQTAFYVTVTTLNNGTNQTEVLDGKVLLKILRAKRQTLRNRLNITITSISAWKADMKKETTTSLEVLPDPTPGSYEHKTSLRATFTVPTTAVVGRVERQSPQGLSQTLFIVIMCSAIGAVVLLIVILVYLFTRFYRRRKGEFVPDESYPHYQSIQERRTAGNNGGGIPSFVDPSLPRITDVPHKPSRAETTGRGAAGKKKKSMGVKITYKPPEWD